MPALSPYLPFHLAYRIHKGGALPAPEAARFDAAMLVSDVSGFTALTERLEVQGRAGAEEVARILQTVLRPPIRSIERWRGSITAFGGDALMTLFLGQSPVRRALAAAEEIQGQFRRRRPARTTIGPVALEIAQVIHHGTVESLHLGEPARRHYAVAGAPIQKLAAMEEASVPGRIEVSREARRVLVEEPPARPWEQRMRVLSSPLFEPYLPPALLPVLGRFLGDYRRIAVLFLESRGRGVSALNRFFLMMADALADHGGILLKSEPSPSGIRWMCTFGLPVAHEDDAERAARAALSIMSHVPRGLALRGGLHEGGVVNVEIGTAARRSHDVIGDAVNTAARAMSAAAWGEVLATEAARAMLAAVATDDRGLRRTKGKSQELHLHALGTLRAATRRSRLEVAFVGRSSELEHLAAALADAAQGMGCAIAVGGEAGMGKTRLADEAARLARDGGFAVLQSRAPSFGRMPFGAFGGLVRGALGLEGDEPHEEVLARLSAGAAELRLTPTDQHHLAHVLGIREPDSPIVHLRPQDVRANDTIALRNLLVAVARSRPHLLVMDDMHLADGDSVLAAERLSREAPDARVVLLLLHRPGYEPAAARRISLQELSGDDVDSLLRAHLGEAAQHLAPLVRERAGGNPLFVEELVAHLIGARLIRSAGPAYEVPRPVDAGEVPASIEALISARLARLSATARAVAQTAAVIGRTFALDLLRQLPRMAVAADKGIRELVASGIIVSSGGDRGPHLFRSVLTRDVAYATVLLVRRRSLHRQVADLLERSPASEARAALIGHHREQAGQVPEARRWFLAGARDAAARFAHEEAERLYRSSIVLASRPSADTAEARCELADRVLVRGGRMTEAEVELQLSLDESRRCGDVRGSARATASLGMVCRSTGRPADARRLTAEALAAYREMGDRGEEGKILGNAALLAFESGSMDEARETFTRALELHREVGNRREAGSALGNLALIEHQQGRIGIARDIYTRALEIHRAVDNPQGEASAVANLGMLDHEQGRLKEALERYEHALAIHRRMGSRQLLGLVLGNMATVHIDMEDFEGAERLLQESLSIRREIGDRRGEGIVLGNLGSLHGETGRIDEAIAAVRGAIEIHRAVGNKLFLGGSLANLASLELFAGNVEGCLRIAAESVSVLEALGERLQLGMLLCTVGHARLALGGEPGDALTKARTLAIELGGRHEGPLPRKLERLELACEAFRKGQPLVRGALPADFTAGQRRWLRLHDPTLPADLLDQ